MRFLGVLSVLVVVCAQGEQRAQAAGDVCWGHTMWSDPLYVRSDGIKVVTMLAQLR